MNFKLFSVLLSGLALAGCTDFLHGKSEKAEVLKIQIVDSACEINFSEQAHKIMRSEAHSDEINQVFDCANQYLDQLQNRVEGQSRADIFEAEDLQHITNRFFKDLDLSLDDVKKIIKFKNAMIGGSELSLAKSEVIHLKKYLGVVRQEVLNLSPYFKMLGVNRLEKDLTEDQILQTSAQLQQSLKTLIQASQITESTYTFQAGIELMKAVGIWTAEDEETVTGLERVLRLFVGDQVLKTAEDYSLAIDNLADAHKLFLRSLYGYLKCEMTSVASTKKAVAFFDEIAALLESSLQFKKTGRLSTYGLDEVVELLIQKNAFPFKVKFTTFRDFYKIALKRVLSQENAEFITVKTFEAYRRESALYKLEIDFLEIKIQDKLWSLNAVREQFSDFITNHSYLSLASSWSAAEKQRIITDLIDVNFDLYNPYAIAIKDKKYVISAMASQLKFSGVDLVRSFYIKMLSRQLIRGWGDGQSTEQLIHASLKKEEMIRFLKDFDQFGIELKLNDPRSKNDGSKNFLEADIMGSYSDGNGVMSMFENFEYLHYLVGEGSWVVSEVQADLKQAGCELSERDVFGILYSSENCFYQNMKHNYSKYFANKPGLVQFLSQMSDQQFYNYYIMLMDVARFESKNKLIKIETVDVQTFVVITGYIESMMVKYDADANGKLSPIEIRTAYPKFKTFATDYSYKNAADSLNKWDSVLNYCRLVYSKEDLIRESFIFMVLNNGRTPTMSDLNYVSCGIKGIFSFKNEANRQSIINTFFVLKSVLTSGQ